MAFHDESQVYWLFLFEKVHISASASVEFQIWLGNDVGLENDAPLKLNLLFFAILKGQLKKHRLWVCNSISDVTSKRLCTHFVFKDLNSFPTCFALDFYSTFSYARV